MEVIARIVFVMDIVLSAIQDTTIIWEFVRVALVLAQDAIHSLVALLALVGTH